MSRLSLFDMPLLASMFTDAEKGARRRPSTVSVPIVEKNRKQWIVSFVTLLAGGVHYYFKASLKLIIHVSENIAKSTIFVWRQRLLELNYCVLFFPFVSIT